MVPILCQIATRQGARSPALTAYHDYIPGQSHALVEFYRIASNRRKASTERTILENGAHFQNLKSGRSLAVNFPGPLAFII